MSRYIRIKLYGIIIKNRKLKEKPCDFYYKDKFLFTVKDVLNFNDVLLQIKNRQNNEFSIVFEGKKIRIDKNGVLETYPKGLFDKNTEILMELL